MLFPSERDFVPPIIYDHHTLQSVQHGGLEEIRMLSRPVSREAKQINSDNNNTPQEQTVFEAPQTPG
jgi:hypothetical protein